MSTMKKYRVYIKYKGYVDKIGPDYDTYQEAWDKRLEYLERFRDTKDFEKAVNDSYINEIVFWTEEETK